MDTNRLRRRGGRAALLTLLGLSAVLAMGCGKKRSPFGLFSGEAEQTVADAGTNPCDQLPDAPNTTPPVPKPCRYWVVDTAAAKTTCQDIAVSAQPPKRWKAANLFDGENVPDALVKYCGYEWSDANSDPTAADIGALPAARSANCTYITPQQTQLPTGPDPFTKWAHDELLPPMANRLPASGAPQNLSVKVRVVVLDTAPSNPSISAPSRHGRTLTQLIRESACQNASTTPADCDVQVTSALAMPRTMNAGVPELTPTGGYFGLLSDLTTAVWRETNQYRFEIEGAATNPTRQKNVPVRVIFNESFGFGNTDALPNRCSATPQPNDYTVAALFDSLMAASCLGVLHVAAAGNDTGGNKYREGMLCPARWDKALVPSDATCQRIWGPAWKTLGERFQAFGLAKSKDATSFAFYSPAVGGTREAIAAGKADSLLSVGGVDYNGMPIVLTRPQACPEAIAIGIGGNAFDSQPNVNPFLFGTSVSAAVASSRIAIKWAQNLGVTATDWQSLSGIAASPFSRTGGLCGGEPVRCANTPWIGKPDTAIIGQNNNWPNTKPEVLWQPLAPIMLVNVQPGVCRDKVPHCNRPSRAMTTDVWPQPTDPACLKCGIYLPIATGSRSYPELWIEPNPSFHPASTGAVLVVENAAGEVVLTRPVSVGSLTSSSRTALVGVDSAMFTNARVWLSGYDSEWQSYSQQIFVDQ